MLNRLIPLALILAVVLACANTRPSNDRAPNRSADNTRPSANNSNSASASKQSAWGYSEQKDAMGRGTIYHTSVVSTNTISLDFPYQGEQHCFLSIREHPQHGKDVYIRIEKGQLLDSDYHGNVLVRFDDDKPKAFSSASPADGSSEALFLGSGAFPFFLTKLKTAKTLKIEFPVYQAGNQICEFDVQGFTWKK